MNYIKSAIVVFFTLSPVYVPSVNADNLFSIEDLTYKGAVRFKDGVYGDSRLGFASGTFAMSENGERIFIVGHEAHQALGEYAVPEFSKSQEVAGLPMALNSQHFKLVLGQATTGNEQGINRITGMNFISGKLVVNGARYYDGGGSNTDTTVVIQNHENLATTDVRGFFKLEGRVHASGWITPIPQVRQEEFGADYIFGFASNLPINSRNSMGPSAFAVKSQNIFNSDPGDQIPTEKLLDFSINNQLHDDHYNEGGENDLWTEISKAYVGFIVPGTDTYAVFGMSAGHEYGIGYKIRQDTGYLCGGGCPRVASDRYSYYWLWNVQDLLAVKRGEKQPFEIRPYDYGKLDLPFTYTGGRDIPNVITAAYYDAKNQDLFLLMGEADTTQGKWEPLPILLAFDINYGKRPGAPTSVSIE